MWPKAECYVTKFGANGRNTILHPRIESVPSVQSVTSVVLFFDTETTGLPRSWNAPVTDSANWPRVVQLAWVLFEPDGQEARGQCDIIRPEGFTVPANMIHGISHQQALREGRALREALREFSLAADVATTIVAHNIDFDRAIMGAEFYRLALPDPLPRRRQVCTMKTTTHLCAIPAPNGRGYKWPKLEELHRVLFRESFEGAHDALADVRATARCYWELRKRGAL